MGFYKKPTNNNNNNKKQQKKDKKLFNFPITLLNYKHDAYTVLLMLKSTELLITNCVREFCYSFG